MKIEIFLKDINSEYTIEPENHSTSAVRNSWEHHGWSHPSPQWHGNRIFKGIPSTDHQQVLQYVQHRKESFGGLAYNKITGIVYELDHEAVQVVDYLKKGFLPSEISKKLNLQEDEIWLLIRKLTVA